MPIVHITRRERFCASHRLARPDWSEAKNLEVFGKCSNPNGHGHNYVLWVTVAGRQDPETSFVCDLGKLSKLIKEHVIDHLDHKNIDVDVPFMKGRYSSTESLCVAIWEQLEAPITGLGVMLKTVKVEETENNTAEYHGEQ
jgi:6-pyruvoyltetrahydropterin/6-carboxytetrahydropterin synthase